MALNERRAIKIRKVAEQRQPNITIILENVHDLHNMGAVMRTADSVGVKEIFTLVTDKKIKLTKVKLGKRTSAGTRRWLDVWAFDNVEKCIEMVRSRYEKIYATHLDEAAVSLYDIDLTSSIALVFGNEKDGVSKELLSHCDGNFIIPQVGMAQSLNISVAAAVTLYEAYRQRAEKDMYGDNNPQTAAQKEALYQDFAARTAKDYDMRYAKVKE
jgi:tRNA (guanosine-2'-O-)-methyltransferase